MKISRGPLGLLLAAVLAMVATDVMAQRGGGGGRGPGGGGGRGPGGGGPGGQGGFGGGGRGGPGGGGGGGTSLSGLLRVEEVQTEIELMPDQEDALKKVSEDRPQFERPEGIDFRDRSEENQAKLQEYLAKMRKQREEADGKFREQLEEILLPEQMERLEQIEVQAMGIRALTNERIAGELKITTSQKAELEKKMESAADDMRSKMREIFTGGDRENMREKMQEATKEMEKDVIGVLSADQKKQLDKMKGKPFEMPQSARGFGGRGGDAGGRGGRGGDGGGRGRGGDGGGRGRGGDGGGGPRGGGRPAAE